MSMLIGLLLSAQLFAATDSQSTMTLESAKPTGRQQIPDDDVDQIITNKKMRAETGSKSRYSLSTSWGYSGGSLAQPFGDRRPNITGAAGLTNFTVLGGSVSARYRINSRSAVSGGVGMRWITPLTSGVPQDFNGQNFDFDNPGVNYQYLFRWWGIQSALSVSQTIFTNSNLRNDGFVTAWGVGTNNAYEVGLTGFTVGWAASFGFGVFDKNNIEARRNQNDYNFGVSPFVEYRFNDRWNLRWDTNLISYQHLRSESRALTFKQMDLIQNFGLGIAVTRDVFISPNVSFSLSNLALDRTNLGVGANLNIF